MGGFVVFLLLLLVVAIVLRIDVFMTIVYLFMGVYLLSRFWTQRIKKNLEVGQAFADHVFSGESVTLDIIIKNAGWLPIPWLLVMETLPVELTPPVPAELLHLKRERDKLDRSLGGMAISTPRPYAVGTVLKVRVIQHADNMDWVGLRVRSSCGQGKRWKLGCQFVSTPAFRPDAFPNLVGSIVLDGTR